MISVKASLRANRTVALPDQGRLAERQNGRTKPFSENATISIDRIRWAEVSSQIPETNRAMMTIVSTCMVP